MRGEPTIRSTFRCLFLRRVRELYCLYSHKSAFNVNAHYGPSEQVKGRWIGPRRNLSTPPTDSPRNNGQIKKAGSLFRPTPCAPSVAICLQLGYGACCKCKLLSLYMCIYIVFLKGGCPKSKKIVRRIIFHKRPQAKVDFCAPQFLI